MKLLLQSAVVTMLVLAAGLVVAQRVADWGDGYGVGGNQKAEFSWSRLQL